MSVLVRTLAIFLVMALGVSGSVQAQQQDHSSVSQALPPSTATPTPTPPTAAASPANAGMPLDLSLYTPAELRVFGARCDAEIAAALARGDTNSALGWAKARSAVAVRLNTIESAPSQRTSSVISSTSPPSSRHHKKKKPSSGEYSLSPEWYANHVKVWDKEHKHWHYEPLAKKGQPGQAAVQPQPAQPVSIATPIPVKPSPTPLPKPSPNPRPTPAAAATESPIPTLEELIRQYKQLKEQSP
jgi:hypothetical protein